VQEKATSSGTRVAAWVLIAGAALVGIGILAIATDQAGY
jgi:hypothetical protein